MSDDARPAWELALARARKFWIAKKHEEALLAFDECGDAPDQAEIHTGKGWCLHKLGRYDAAIVEFDRAEFLYGRAKSLIELGRIDDAIATLRADLKRGKKASEYSKEVLEELLAKASGGAGGSAGAAASAKETSAKPKRAAKAAPALEPAGPIPTRKKGESYDAFVTRLLAAAKLGAALEKIEAARVLGVALHPKKLPRGGGEVGASRLGGLPDLPPSTKWPEHEGRPMLFVMQLRLGDMGLPKSFATLPTKGLLSFFVCEGLDHDEYLDACSVIHTTGAAVSRLAARALPDGWYRTYDGEQVNKPFGARALEPELVHKLPNPSGVALTRAKLHPDVLTRYSSHVFEPAMASDEGGRHQLLGVRDRSYAGDKPATQTLLLQCVTEPDLDMHRGDEDAIYIKTPTTALAKADFSKSSVNLGD